MALTILQPEREQFWPTAVTNTTRLFTPSSLLISSRLKKTNPIIMLTKFVAVLLNTEISESEFSSLSPNAHSLI